MKNKYLKIVFLCLFFYSNTLFAQRNMENLDRGVVAVRTSPASVYIGWRMLGTEADAIAFNIYRGGKKINTTPIITTTNYVDSTEIDATYIIKSVINGKEIDASKPAEIWAKQSLKIPIQQPPAGVTPDGKPYTYNANDASVGDVDGDGQYEIILKWDPSNAHDNSQAGYTGDVYLDCYKMDGRLLWRIDLGKNIRAGAHYTQFLVYDFDSDGKAEVVCKTADGTKDGQGKFIGDSAADYRTNHGYILSGPEFLTVFNGETGAEMATVNYLPSRGSVSSWGDAYGNRVDRFIACVAYCDGIHPSIIMGRGYYTRLVRVAYDWKGGKLTRRWTFDSDANHQNLALRGQGNHQLIGADVDGDGKDEITNGASAIKSDGTILYANGLGHGDAIHLTDMDPDRPGLEVWQCHEDEGEYGKYAMEFRDAATGEPLWGVASHGDIGRAMAADIDPRYLGYECWGSTGGLYSCKGELISEVKPNSMDFGVWWDADLQRELLNGTKLEKWDYKTGTLSRIMSLDKEGAASNNGTKATPCLTADLLGDWREEIVMRSADNQNLLLFTTTIPANNRMYTLMHDPNYRLAIAWQNTAYNQPPNPGFYLGEQMKPPPKPNIKLVLAK